MGRFGHAWACPGMLGHARACSGMFISLHVMACPQQSNKSPLRVDQAQTCPGMHGRERASSGMFEHALGY